MKGDGMRMRNRVASALAALFMGGLLILGAAPASAQTPEEPKCPPGLPPGRPPGRPPTNPPTAGQPEDRPPSYPPGRCRLALNRNFAEQGGVVGASGDGFVPGERVTITIAGQQVKSLTAGSDGTFATDLVVPASAPLGDVEVRAFSGTHALTANLEVVAAAGGAAQAAPASSGMLPRTGGEMVGLGVAGAGLIGVGAAAVVMTRRRKATTAA